MWSLIASAMSSVGGLIAMLAVVASLVGSGAYVMGEIKDGQAAKERASYAVAQAKAVTEAAARQKQLDQTTMAAANAEVSKQKTLELTRQQELADVPAHVFVKACVPWGVIRVLDAAILGVGADSLHLPPGATDAACSPFNGDTVARTVVSNYGNARANTEQLTALQAWARQIAGVRK